MSAVFISYRRNDSSGHTGRIYDYLCEEFGTDVIFRDIDTIEPGADFVEAVDKGIQGCSALIVVIGSEWLTAEDEMGRRLDDPNDFVRIEVASALKKNLRVIPVLVKGAVMPAAKDLPDDIALLARRHALELSDSRWDYDMGRLIEAIRPLLLEGTQEQAPDLEHDQSRQNDARDDNQPEAASIIPDEEITPTKPPVVTKPPGHYLVFGVIGIALIAAVIFWLTQSPDETNITDDTRPDVTSDSSTSVTTTEITKPRPVEKTIIVPQQETTTEHPESELASVVDDKAHAKIERLINSANKDIKALRLTSPRGNNAVEKFSMILELEPEHPGAREGIVRVAEKYVSLAHTAFTKGQLEKAEQLLEQAQSLDPANKDVRNMQREITQIMQREHQDEIQRQEHQQAALKARREKEAEDRRLEEIQANKRIQSCFDDCQQQHQACNYQLESVNENCVSKIEAECEKVHQACLGDPQTAMTWGDLGAESECLGRWNQCKRESSQQCAEGEINFLATCESEHAACKNTCQ